MIPVGLLFLPNLIFMPDQLEIAHTFGLEQSTRDKAFTILSSPESFIYGLDAIPDDRGVRWGIRIIFFLFIAYTYFKLYKKNKTLNNAYLERINVTLIAIIAFIILLSSLITLTGIIYEVRYMTVIFPLFILLFSLFKIHSSLSRSLIYCTVSIYFIILAMSNYKYPAMTYDYRSMANYVNRVEQYQEPILVYDNTFSLPFTLYYNGDNPIVPLPHGITFDKNFIVNVKDTFELKKIVGKLKTPTESFLLISNYTTTDYLLKANRKMIDDYLSIHFETSLDTFFFDKNKFRYLRIRRLENKETYNSR